MLAAQSSAWGQTIPPRFGVASWEPGVCRDLTAALRGTRTVGEIGVRLGEFLKVPPFEARLDRGSNGVRFVNTAKPSLSIRIYKNKNDCSKAANKAAAGTSAPTFASVVLPELACQRPPHSGAVMQQLTRSGIAKSNAFTVADSINYFMLDKPQDVVGLSAVAVMVFDENSTFRFRRAPGTSPGQVPGFVTRASTAQINEWAARHGLDLDVQETMTNLRGARDVYCRRPAE
jgi:hypothetical protein